MMTEAGRRRLDDERVENPTHEQFSLPWGGRNPRALTQAYIRFSLKAQDDGVPDVFEENALEEQCRRHHYGW